VGGNPPLAIILRPVGASNRTYQLLKHAQTAHHRGQQIARLRMLGRELFIAIPTGIFFALFLRR
jgi:uncharacterized damage-inducible protein DinB